MTLDELRRLRPDLPEDLLAAGLDLYEREQSMPRGLDYSREAGLRNVVGDMSAPGDGYDATADEPAAPRRAALGGGSKRRGLFDTAAEEASGELFMGTLQPETPQAELPEASTMDALKLGYERAKTMGVAMGTKAGVYTDEELASAMAADTKLAASTRRPDSAKAIESAAKAANEDPSVLSALKVVGTAITNPGGLLHMTAENAANQLPGLVAPLAGMAYGGSTAGPVGAVVGLVGGSILGNSPEFGGKIVELAGQVAQERGLDPTDPQQLLSVLSDPAFKEESTKQGLIKWGVISGIDAVSGGVAGRIVSAPARGLIADAGTDIAAKVMAKEALSAGEKAAAGDALGKFAATQTLKSRAGRYAAAIGTEMGGETVGEFSGELAASGEARLGDALVEGLVAGPQSAVMSYGSGQIQTPAAASALRDAQLDYTLSNPPADEQVAGEDNRVKVDLPWFREYAKDRIAELEAGAQQLDDQGTAVGLSSEQKDEVKKLTAALENSDFAKRYAEQIGYSVVEEGDVSHAQANIPIGVPVPELPADDNDLRNMLLPMSDDERAAMMIGMPKAQQARVFNALPHGRNGGAATLLKAAIQQRTEGLVAELQQLDDQHLEVRARNDQNPFVSQTAAKMLLERRANGTQQLAEQQQSAVPKMSKVAEGLLRTNPDVDFAGLADLTPAGADGSLLKGQVEDYIRGKRDEAALAGKQQRFDQLTKQGKLINDHFSVVAPEELSDNDKTVEYSMNGRKIRANRVGKDSFNRLQKIAKFFNKEVVLVRDERPKLDSYSDGFVINDEANANKVFLNIDATSAGHLVLLGHELTHHLEKALGGKIYQKLSDAIAPHLNANAEEFQRSQGYAGDTQENVFREIRADLMGNRFGRQDFWEKVFKEIEGREAGLAKRIKDTVVSWLRTTANKMALTRQYANSEKELISQLRGAATAVDKAFVKAAADFIKTENGIKLRQNGNKQTADTGYAPGVTADQLSIAPDTQESRRRPGSDIGHSREAGGRYVGSPDWVGSSSSQLAVLRKTLERLTDEGEPGRHWYERSSKAILDLVNGNKADAEKLAQLIAIYSPSNAVPGNTTMALKAFYQWKQGEPIRVGTTVNDTKANELLYQGKEWSGIKTNSFYQNLMQEIDPSKNDAGAATMDMWMSLAFDYGMLSVDQGPKYKFMQREIQRIARNKGWTPHQVQAAIWTAMKGRIEPIRGDITAKELDNGWHNQEAQSWWADHRADYIKRRNKYMIDRANGKPVVPPTIKKAGVDTLLPDRRRDHYRLAHEMGMNYDLKQQDVTKSKYDFSDAINERTAQMSWEAAPGVSTGVLPGFHSAPVAEQLEYLAMIRAALTDKDGNDIIGKVVGAAFNNSTQAFSGWQGVSSAGIQDGIAVPVNLQEGGVVQDVARRALNLIADIRGLVLRQEAVAWHMPLYKAGKYAQNGIEFKINRLLTEAENTKLYRAISDRLGNTESPPIPTSDGTGFRVIYFPSEKFALMDEQLYSAVDGDLLGDTGQDIKDKLQDVQRKKNKAFHDAVKDAVSEQDWYAEVEESVEFGTDGELRDNDWSNGDADYRGRIAEAAQAAGFKDEGRWAGRSDIFQWIDDELRPAVEAVNRRAAQKFGWEYNGELDLQRSALRPDAAGDRLDGGVPSSEVRGELQPEAVSATGVHYSAQPRQQLSSGYFGQGLRGAENERLRNATDERIKQRIYFYVNAGRGINPEQGVGAHAHTLQLQNLYDSDNDPRDLWFRTQPNDFESAVLDNGFDGYLSAERGVAILLGPRVEQPAYAGTGKPTVDRAGAAAPSDRGQMARQLQNARSLPMGQMSGADWKRLLPAVLPGFDTSHLADGQMYYKDQLLPAVQRSVLRELTINVDPRPEEAIVTPMPAYAKTDAAKTSYLKKLTKENVPFIKELTRQIDDAFGTESKDNQKDFDNIILKANRPSILAKKPWHSVEHIRDSYRFKTVLNDYRDLPGIIKMLQDSGVGFVKVDLPKVLYPKEWGFRIAAFDIRMPNGQLMEFYTPVREVEEAKATGHLIFERWRNDDISKLPDHLKMNYIQQVRESYRLYRQAWDASLERTQATDNDVLASLFKVAASFGGTSPNDSKTSPGWKDGNSTQTPSMRPAVRGKSGDSRIQTLDRSSVASTTSIGNSFLNEPIVADTSTAGTAVEQLVQNSTMREDMDQQMAWLTDKATTVGYTSIDDLLANDPRQFFEFAEEWRAANPEIEAGPVQASVIRQMLDDQENWPRNGVLPAKGLMARLGFVNDVINAVRKGETFDNSPLPVMPTPPVLRMLNLPFHWITASSGISQKLFASQQGTDADYRAGKHAADFENLSAEQLYGMMSDPVAVVRSGRNEYEVITNQFGEKGPIMFAIKTNVSPMREDARQYSIVLSGYSLDPNQIINKIKYGEVLYSKGEGEVIDLHRAAVAAYKAWYPAALKKAESRGERLPGTSPGAVWASFPPGVKQRLSGNTVKTPQSLVKWNQQRPTAVQRSVMRAHLADKVMDVEVPTRLARSVRDNLSDAIRGGDQFNFLHKTVATQLHKARVNPEFGRVFDLGQKFLDYTAMFAMRAQEKAPSILPDLGKMTLRNALPWNWGELSGLKELENEQLGQLLAEGTLFNGPNPHTGKVFTDAELRAKGLTDSQIDHYREARAAIDQALDDSAKSLMVSFARQAGIDPNDLDAFLEIPVPLRDVHRMIVSELNALGKTGAVKDANRVLWEAESLKKNGYAPLMRFGEFTVRATDKNGDTTWFSMHESKADAARTAAKVAHLGTVETGRLNPIESQMFSAISPGLIESFAKHIPLNSAAEKQAMEEYLRLATTQRSAMQRMMKREGIAGYSNDATRVLASYVTATSRQNSKLVNDPRITKAVTDIKDGEVRKEAQLLAEYLRNPQEGAAKIRGFLFFNFLGGSIAAGIVNMTQPVLMTYPYLAQWGVGRAGTAMTAGMNATKQWLSARKVSNPELHAALQKAHDQGIIEPQEIFQMMAAAETGTASILGHKFMRIWGINFAFTEAINRTLTFSSAYQIGADVARKDGLTGTAASQSAYNFAVRAVEDTQGLYNKGNRPNWARESGTFGVAGTLAFTFKQYSIAYVEFLKRLWDNKLVGKRSFAIAIGMLMLAAGTNGLPGSDDLDDLLETALAWLGYPKNMKKVKKQFLMDTFGLSAEAADAAMVGISKYMKLDVQARLGLGNLIPGTSLLNPTKKASTSEMAEPFGPIGGVISNAFKSAQGAARGDARAAVLPILPKAAADLAKGLEMANTGQIKDNAGRLIDRADAVDAFVKSIGFQPEDFAKRARAMREITTDTNTVHYVQDTYNGMMARALVEKDSKLRDKAQLLIKEWNRANPELAIKSDMATIIKRAKQMQLPQTERFINATPKAQRAMVAETLRQAAE
jgi:hypothetical protein